MASLARRQPATAMQLFERNTEVDRLSEALQRSRDADQTLDLQVTLAWYLRQRDNTRAQQLLQLARTRIDNQPLSPALEQHRARLLLVEGETLWLLSDFDSATTRRPRGLGRLESQGHFAGCADCHALIVSVCSSTGELPKRDAALAQAVDYVDRPRTRTVWIFSRPTRHATPCCAMCTWPASSGASVSRMR